MRIEGLITIAILFAVSACTTSSAYEETVVALNSDHQVSAGYAYVPIWVPIGVEGGEYKLTDENYLASEEYLKSCSEKLNASIFPAPRKEIRTVLLMNCMKEKGWYPYIEEILIMR